MSVHHVVVTRDQAGLDRLARFRPPGERDVQEYYQATIECDQSHGGADPEVLGYEDVLLHGVYHEWKDGWAVEYPGCVVAGGVWEGPDDLDTKVDGRYRVDVGEECYLTSADKP